MSLMTQIFGSSDEKDSDTDGLHIDSDVCTSPVAIDIPVKASALSKLEERPDKSDGPPVQDISVTCSVQHTFIEEELLHIPKLNKFDGKSGMSSPNGNLSKKDNDIINKDKLTRTHDDYSRSVLLQSSEESIDLYSDILGGDDCWAKSANNSRDNASKPLLRGHSDCQTKQVVSSKHGPVLHKQNGFDIYSDLNDGSLRNYCETRNSSGCSSNTDVHLNNKPSTELPTADASKDRPSVDPSAVKSQLSLDLYTELLCDDAEQREVSNQEIRSRFIEAQNYISYLHEKLDSVMMSNEKLLQENMTLKKNISSMFLTAQTELNRKTSQIFSLRKLNHPSAVNALAKKRRNGYRDNSPEGSDNMATQISDTGYRNIPDETCSLFHGKSSTNVDSDGKFKSSKLVSSKHEYSEEKVSRDFNETELAKKRKYNRDSPGGFKKQKLSPYAAKRIVDKYHARSVTPSQQMEKQHTDDLRNKILKKPGNGEKYSVGNRLKERKLYENDAKSEKENIMKSVPKYERDKRTPSKRDETTKSYSKSKMRTSEKGDRRESILHSEKARSRDLDLRHRNHQSSKRMDCDSQDRSDSSRHHNRSKKHSEGASHEYRSHKSPKNVSDRTSRKIKKVDVIEKSEICSPTGASERKPNDSGKCKIPSKRHVRSSLDRKCKKALDVDKSSMKQTECNEVHHKEMVISTAEEQKTKECGVHKVIEKWNTDQSSDDTANTCPVSSQSTAKLYIWHRNQSEKRLCLASVQEKVLDISKLKMNEFAGAICLASETTNKADCTGLLSETFCTKHVVTHLEDRMKTQTKLKQLDSESNPSMTESEYIIENEFNIEDMTIIDEVGSNEVNSYGLSSANPDFSVDTSLVSPKENNLKNDIEQGNSVSQCSVILAKPISLGDGDNVVEQGNSPSSSSLVLAKQISLEDGDQEVEPGNGGSHSVLAKQMNLGDVDHVVEQGNSSSPSSLGSAKQMILEDGDHEVVPCNGGSHSVLLAKQISLGDGDNVVEQGNSATSSSLVSAKQVRLEDGDHEVEPGDGGSHSVVLEKQKCLGDGDYDKQGTSASSSSLVSAKQMSVRDDCDAEQGNCASPSSLVSTNQTSLGDDHHVEQEYRTSPLVFTKPMSLKYGDHDVGQDNNVSDTPLLLLKRNCLVNGDHDVQQGNSASPSSLVSTKQIIVEDGDHVEQHNNVSNPPLHLLKRNCTVNGDHDVETGNSETILNNVSSQMNLNITQEVTQHVNKSNNDSNNEISLEVSITAQAKNAENAVAITEVKDSASINQDSCYTGHIVEHEIKNQNNFEAECEMKVILKNNVHENKAKSSMSCLQNSVAKDKLMSDIQEESDSSVEAVCEKITENVSTNVFLKEDNIFKETDVEDGCTVHSSNTKKIADVVSSNFERMGSYDAKKDHYPLSIIVSIPKSNIISPEHGHESVCSAEDTKNLENLNHSDNNKALEPAVEKIDVKMCDSTEKDLLKLDTKYGGSYKVPSKLSLMLPSVSVGLQLSDVLCSGNSELENGVLDKDRSELVDSVLDKDRSELVDSVLDKDRSELVDSVFDKDRNELHDCVLDKDRDELHDRVLHDKPVYKLHRIEQMSHEIKSWKAKIDEFSSSNYTSHETWEYESFSNITKQISKAFDSSRHESVFTSTPKAQSNAFVALEKSLAFNESAIMSSEHGDGPCLSHTASIADIVESSVPLSENKFTTNIGLQNNSALSDSDYNDQTLNHSGDVMCGPEDTTVSNLMDFNATKVIKDEPAAMDYEASNSNIDSYYMDSNHGSKLECVKLEGINCSYSKKSLANLCTDSNFESSDLSNTNEVNTTQVFNPNTFSEDVDKCGTFNRDVLQGLQLNEASVFPASYSDCEDSRSSSFSDTDDDSDVQIIRVYLKDSDSSDSDCTHDSSITTSETQDNCFDQETSETVDRDTWTIDTTCDKLSEVIGNDECDTSSAVATSKHGQSNTVASGKYDQSDTMATVKCDQSIGVDEDKGTICSEKLDGSYRSCLNTEREQFADVFADNCNESSGSCRGKNVTPSKVVNEKLCEMDLGLSGSQPVECGAFEQGCARTRVFEKKSKQNNTHNNQSSVDSLEMKISESFNANPFNNSSTSREHLIKDVEKRHELNISSVLLETSEKNVPNTADAQAHDKNVSNLEEIQPDSLPNGNHPDKENQQMLQQYSDTEQQFPTSVGTKETKHHKNENNKEYADTSTNNDVLFLPQNTDSFIKNLKQVAKNHSVIVDCGKNVLCSSNEKRPNNDTSDESDSSDEESSDSDELDTSSDSDSCSDELDSVFSASSAILNSSQQTMIESEGNIDDSDPSETLNAVGHVNDLFCKIQSNEPNKNIDKAKQHGGCKTSHALNNVFNKMSSNTINREKAKMNTRNGKTDGSALKLTTEIHLSAETDAIRDNSKPVCSEKSTDFLCISIDSDDLQLSDYDGNEANSLELTTDKRIHEDNTLEDGEIDSDSPSDLSVKKPSQADSKSMIQPLSKLKRSASSISSTLHQRGNRQGTKLSRDLHRRQAGELQSLEQASKKCEKNPLLKDYKIPRKTSLSSNKRKFSNFDIISRSPKRKRNEKEALFPRDLGRPVCSNRTGRRVFSPQRQSKISPIYTKGRKLPWTPPQRNSKAGLRYSPKYGRAERNKRTLERGHYNHNSINDRPKVPRTPPEVAHRKDNYYKDRHSNEIFERTRRHSDSDKGRRNRLRSPSPRTWHLNDGISGKHKENDARVQSSENRFRRQSSESCTPKRRGPRTPSPLPFPVCVDQKENSDKKTNRKQERENCPHSANVCDVELSVEGKCEQNLHRTPDRHENRLTHETCTRLTYLDLDDIKYRRTRSQSPSAFTARTVPLGNSRLWIGPRTPPSPVQNETARYSMR